MSGWTPKTLREVVGVVLVVVFVVVIGPGHGMRHNKSISNARRLQRLEAFSASWLQIFSCLMSTCFQQLQMVGQTAASQQWPWQLQGLLTSEQLTFKKLQRLHLRKGV